MTTDTLVYLELRKLNDQISQMVKALSVFGEQTKQLNDSMAKFVASLEDKN